MLSPKTAASPIVPDPAGGAYDAPPDPLVGWGGGYPSPFFYPLDAFDVSILGAFDVSGLTLAMCPPKTLFGPLLAGVWRRRCHLIICIGLHLSQRVCLQL